MIEILVAYLLYENSADVVWWVAYAVVLIGKLLWIAKQRKEKHHELHGV
jgi:hypothetical protein